MGRRFADWLAWATCAVSLLVLALALVLTALVAPGALPRGFSSWQENVIEAIGLVGAPVLGALISSRRPENPYGWLWSVAGLGLALSFLASSYAAYAAVNPGALPAPKTVAWALEMGWVVGVSFCLFSCSRMGVCRPCGGDTWPGPCS